MLKKGPMFIDARHHAGATEGKQQEMLAKLEVFLHAYYDLLEATGGPPDKYRPDEAVTEGLAAVERLWWASLDDDS